MSRRASARWLWSGLTTIGVLLLLMTTSMVWERSAPPQRFAKAIHGVERLDVLCERLAAAAVAYQVLELESAAIVATELYKADDMVTTYALEAAISGVHGTWELEVFTESPVWNDGDSKQIESAELFYRSRWHSALHKWH